jgi:uncharacterized delta-60 repeat protein
MARRRVRNPLVLILALLALATAAAALAAPRPVALDSSFGTGGVVSSGTIMPGFHEAGGIAVTARRDILLASEGIGGVTLARFFPGGDLDSGYAKGVGLVQLPNLTGIGDVVAAEDESAFVLTESTTVTKVGRRGAVATGFGDEGSVQIPALDPRFEALHFRALAALPDGGVLAAGLRFGSPRMVVVRLLADGRPDPGFGEDGLATVPIAGRGSGAFTVAVQANGRIVLGGYALGRPALARLLAGGRPDRSFGGDGVVLAPKRLRGRVTALSLQPHGGILVAGPGIAWRNKGNGVFLLRYGRTGERDPRFGPRGLAARLPRYATPTAMAAIGGRFLLSATGPEASLKLFSRRGRPLDSLEGAPGIPSRQFHGIHAAAQAGKLLFAWTPPHRIGHGEIRLERFLVR